MGVLIVIILLIANCIIINAILRFDPTALLQEILIPADAAVGSIIYRLRASDPQILYPLTFTLKEETTTVSIDSLNCTRLNSICHANVILRKRLEPERFYDFTVNVKNQRGEAASLNCSFRATNATTPISDIFPGAPTLLMVSEKSRRNTELGTIIAKGNPAKANGVLLELWGSPQFGLYQKLITNRDAQGTIVLLDQLDYETRTVHHLVILANDPWTVMSEDTRNIASWPILVAVLDEQDTPPVFTLAPPTTTLSPTLLPGDVILRIHAEDGDRGAPRDIRYGLVPEGNPFTTFFNISEETGELRLIRPLSDILAISHSGQPLLLTVIAEEVRTNPQEPPSQSSTIQLALIPPGIKPGTPIFGASEYNVLLDENSPTGTLLNLPQAEIVTQSGDVVTLTLTGNNGTFDIAPSVVEGQAKFEVRVHDPKLLDYEKWHSVQCYIVAREIGSGNFTAKVKLMVLLNDVNDNAPEFTQDKYQVSIQENAKFGTTVLRVEANDIDREPGNKIKYTRLIGSGSDFFNLDPDSGIVTVSDHGDLDAEETPVFTLQIEAVDENGKGQTSTSTIIINLIDINDEVPQFDKTVYEFILNQDRDAFTTRAFISATDRDITSPNNEVHYELINPVKNLYLNEKTGELLIMKQWTESKIIIIIARAWDGGIPRLFSECEIRIYPPDGRSRKMVFIVSGRDPEVESVKRIIKAVTGGDKITIHEIRPYTGIEPGATDVSKSSTYEKSVVEATVTYSEDSIVDVNTVQQVLDERQITTSTKLATVTKPGGNLLWLLLLLLILALLLALTLILCCICQGCPLYIPPKRRKIVSSEIKKIVHGAGNGRESKSVQVAEWFGRREAWTPEHEIESLQRHEQERGSERILHRREPSRDQLYIREGNTDILRLITRGSETQRPVTLMQDGKDILMQRFIDQSQMSLPNAVSKLQTEHEMLEASLRQQNALLRQILQDRERDLRLETQSLPAGTQTDQDAGTQTEPQYLRRKVRSDNDATDGSDDEYTAIRARTRFKQSRGRRHLRKIKTPIQEESEIEVNEKPLKNKPNIRQTRTSELRRKASSTIRKEVLREISASLDNSNSEEDHYEIKKQRKKYFSEDSLEEEISPRSDKTTDSGRHKYHSESDLLRVKSPLPQLPSEQDINKSQSQTDLSKDEIKEKRRGKIKRTSRYMEWYNKSARKTTSKDTETDSQMTKQTKSAINEKIPPAKEDKLIKETVTKLSNRLLKDTESSARKKIQSKKSGIGPEHPLLQHSEHRFEVRYPKLTNKKPEEDTDSGIALSRLPIAQKKSVFTIAYDDMHTSQLKSDSRNSPL